MRVMTAWEGSINCRYGVRPFPGWAGLRQGGILVQNETGAVPPWGMAGGRRPWGHEPSNASTTADPGSWQPTDPPGPPESCGISRLRISSDELFAIVLGDKPGDTYV